MCENCAPTKNCFRIPQQIENIFTWEDRFTRFLKFWNKKYAAATETQKCGRCANFRQCEKKKREDCRARGDRARDNHVKNPFCSLRLGLWPHVLPARPVDSQPRMENTSPRSEEKPVITKKSNYGKYLVVTLFFRKWPSLLFPSCTSKPLLKWQITNALVYVRANTPSSRGQTRGSINCMKHWNTW